MPLALDVSVVVGGGGEGGGGASPSSSSSSSPALPQQQQRFCVAWGGGATPGGGGTSPFLGVPAALAALLRLKEGATVDVRPLLLHANGGASSSTSSPSSSSNPPQPPPRATRVSVTPRSADDWEVVQAQAGLLEESITSQVGLVSVGSPFPVFVPRAGGGGAPVSLVATAIEPAGFSVAFLGPGCEFVVAPVARRGKEEEEGGGGKEQTDEDGGSEDSSSSSVSWLRVLPSAAARAASLAGARFAPPRAPLPLLLAETESMPAGKRLATVPSTTAWAPASAVERLSRSLSSKSSPSSPPVVVVALSSGLGSRSPKLYLSLKAADTDSDDESPSPFSLPAGHLALPEPAARASGVVPGRRAALRRCSSSAISAGGGGGGDAGVPSLVILRPDRGAVERRGGRGENDGGEQRRRGPAEEQPPPPAPAPPSSHPVLSALSAAGPAELAALFSAWLAAQAFASSTGGVGGGKEEPPAIIVVCDGAVVRLMLVDDDNEDDEQQQQQTASCSSSHSSSSPYLDFAIEFRWPGGNRRPGSPVLLSPDSALRVELGTSAEMLPPAAGGDDESCYFSSSSPHPRLSWPDSEPLPPFGSSWTREHLRALLEPLRAPLDSRARALLRAFGPVRRAKLARPPRRHWKATGRP